MTFRSSYRPRRNEHESLCKCDDPHVSHYTRSGACVSPGCGCLEFRAKGRPEYNTAKHASCQYGHSHDSGLEVSECADLHYLKLAGTIKSFKFHPIIDLPGPSGRTVATYELDFEVEWPDGMTEFIECKGDHLAREMGWRLKWALLRDKHHGDPKYKFRVRRG